MKSQFGMKCLQRVVRLDLWTMIVIVLFGAASAIGQQITATIMGTVKDQQGALVSTATVKAVNVDTGFTKSASTNDVGAYSLTFLPVGKYRVEVAAAGFKKFTQEDIVLVVNQMQALDVVLTLGGQNETVIVTTAPPLINTQSSGLSSTIEASEIVGLPLVNRNAYAEISLIPGVQANSMSPTGNTQGTPNFVVGAPSEQVQINGGIDAGVPTVSYYLDGGMNMTGIRNYGNILPNPDALQEFRIETSNYQAEYGRMSGAVISAVTRSGTNDVHGSLFEFNRNTDFNAYPWGATTKQPYHRNQFGATIGGPVRRDRAFFFGSYAGLRQNVGTFISSTEVPTAAERLGDFTNLPAGETKPKITGTNSSPNCTVATLGCLPKGSLDPTAANYLSKYVPLPNIDANHWAGYFVGPLTEDEYLAKYDQNLSEKNHFVASYFLINVHQDTNGGGLPVYVNRSYSRQQNLNLSEVYALNDHTDNQVWLNFVRVYAGRVNLPDVGIEDLGSNFTTQGVKTLPNINISGYFSGGGALAGPLSATDQYDVRDMVSTTKGHHNFVYGLDISLEKDMYVANLYNYGSFNFSTSTPGSTGNALADFVAGITGSMEQDTPYHALLNTWYYSFFLQDNYRVSPRLTLNLGLRYDLEPSPVESQNLTQTFVPNVQSTEVPTAPKGLLYPGDAGVPRGIVPTRKDHISPRVGIAWDPFGNGKTAFHAAGGVFYGSVSSNEWTQPANAQPFCVQQTFNSIKSLTDVYGNPASFPTGDPFPYTFTPSNPRFLSAAKVIGTSESYKWPQVFQFSSSIEQQLPQSINMSIAYVGTLSRYVPFQTDANYAAWASGATTSQTSLNNRRPYDPGVLGNIYMMMSNQSASYHALQIAAHRRMSQNLSLNGFFVLSHTLTSFNSSGVGFGAPQDIDAMWEDRGPASTDRRYTSALSGTWNVDYYHGQSSILKQAFNGWTVSPILYLNSGAPFTVTTGSDKNADGNNTDRPNLVPGVSPFLSPHRSRTLVARQWFDSTAFTPNGPGLGIGIGGADGNTPPNYLRAPGFRDIDLGLFRDIRFERGITLQIRGEATNAFNLVSLNAPTSNISSSMVGRITSASTSRLIQLGARLTF